MHQWTAHEVGDMLYDSERSQGVLHRHFRGINTNWKERRTFDERPAEKHVIDHELLEAMKIFDGA